MFSFAACSMGSCGEHLTTFNHFLKRVIFFRYDDENCVNKRQRACLPDFIRWEPGTSYRFCRTEVKKDGGNTKEDSPKMVFAALKNHK